MTFKTRALCQVSLVAGAACFAMASMPAGPAMAEDGIWNSMLSFMGMGKSKDQVQDDSIDYAARPALVVPPKMDLPPPQTAAAHPADWPKDPDAAARHRAEADSRRPAPPSDSDPSTTETADAQDKSDTTGSIPSSVSHKDKKQIFPGFGGQSLAGSPGVSLGHGAAQAGDCSQVFGTSICAPWQWFDLSGNEDAKMKTLKVGVEPPRQYLVQPPPGYQLPVVADEPDSADAANESSVSDQSHQYKPNKPKAPGSTENGLGQLIRP